MVLSVLDAAAVRQWCAGGLADLTAAQHQIDAINVYPVPDGDTGTNLVLTMRAVMAALAETPAIDAPAASPANGPPGSPEMTRTVRAMARGALLGAHGNSGVIVSQLLRGIADVLAGCGECGGAQLRQALARAADLGYAAVDAPVEGTVLSVARAAAVAARDVASDELAVVARAAADGAARALTRTRDQLAVLAAADVVDAGGWGLVILLEALYAVIRAAPEAAPGRPSGPTAEPWSLGSDGATCSPIVDQGFAYEVQFLLDADEPALRRLTARLRNLGDSLTVAGDGAGGWHVHVHVDDVGAAVEAGIEAGRPSRIRVTRFTDQAPMLTAARPRTGVRLLVVIGAEAGLSDLFESAGAVVVTGTGGRRPTPAELTTAVTATGAAEVVLVTTLGDGAPAAAEAAAVVRQHGVTVAVVPSRSSMQAMAALAVAQSSRRFDDDVIAMTAAAGATRWGEVMVAPGDFQTSAGICTAGDVLGLIEDDVVVIGTEVEVIAADLLERLLTGGGELVTVVTGADADDGLGDRLAARVRTGWPAAETVVYAIRQPRRPVLLSVE